METDMESLPASESERRAHARPDFSEVSGVPRVQSGDQPIAARGRSAICSATSVWKACPSFPLLLLTPQRLGLFYTK